MKNRHGFYIKSLNCRQAEAEGRDKISFRCTEAEARGLGVEWHHGGSGIIAFFPENDAQKQRVLDLKKALTCRKIKTKREALAYLETTTGNFKIPYKIGKYGKFFDFWGEEDGYLSIDENDPNFNACKALLGF